MHFYGAKDGITCCYPLVLHSHNNAHPPPYEISVFDFCVVILALISDLIKFLVIDLTSSLTVPLPHLFPNIPAFPSLTLNRISVSHCKAATALNWEGTYSSLEFFALPFSLPPSLYRSILPCTTCSRLFTFQMVFIVPLSLMLMII